MPPSASRPDNVSTARALDKGSLSIELPCFQGAGHKIISGMVRRGFHCCYHRNGQKPQRPTTAASAVVPGWGPASL
jgi:hypothetical protein